MPVDSSDAKRQDAESWWLPNWTAEAGETLSFRLEPDSGPIRRLRTTVKAALGWSLVAGWLDYVAWQQHQTRQASWILFAMLGAPLSLAALVLAGIVVTAWLRSRWFRGVRVEISRHPLKPGDKASIFVNSADFDVELIGEELARETRLAFRSRPFETIAIKSIEQFVEIPENAMHSFVCDPYAIVWRIRLKHRRRGFERSYPILVLPSAKKVSAS